MKTREVTDKLQDWQKQIKAKASDMTEATDDYVRENTWTSVAIAAAVGVFLGYLLGGRRDD
jgi:ElaB/YqjD/DUF883 family membrane-anchored ribosome-binding protein